MKLEMSSTILTRKTYSCHLRLIKNRNSYLTIWRRKNKRNKKMNSQIRSKKNSRKENN